MAQGCHVEQSDRKATYNLWGKVRQRLAAASSATPQAAAVAVAEAEAPAGGSRGIGIVAGPPGIVKDKAMAQTMP